MNEVLKNIDKIPLLQSVHIEDYLSRRLFRIASYNKGKLIHSEGDECRSLEAVIKGKIAIERIDESGNLFTVVEFYPQDVFGGNLIFSSNPYYPMNVTAQTDVIILEIPREILYELCFNNRKFLELFLRLISDNALMLGDKIKHFTNRTIRECICTYLKQEYLLQNSYRIMLGTTKKALAERIGVQRTSLSRELQKMKQERLIVYDSISITILEPCIVQ
ncbi:MAG: Crp/Fnr family transcriptional regulator [Bacillota bacterium]